METIAGLGKEQQIVGIVSIAFVLFQH